MPNPIQRRITLIRHAKAEDDGVTQDHQRHLNARGKQEAAALGEWLKEADAVPQLIVCSTANRTRETLEQLDLPAPVILSDRAYLASAGDLMKLIQESDDAVTHIAVIAHNPGLHQLAATLAGEYANDNDADQLLLKFPTAACAVLAFRASHWHELAPQGARLEQFVLRK